MEIEKDVDLVDQGPDFTGTGKLARLPRPVQHRRIPEPVHILIDKARGSGLARVEAGEGGEIDEAEGDPSTLRPELHLEQAGKRDRPCDLIAVRERDQPDMRPRFPGIA